MPVRQRSPSSQGSAAASATATSFQTTTSMPQDPNYSDASAYRTMRSRNPDGSSTVYRVHESVMRGGVMGTTPTSAPPPPPNGPYYRGGGHGGGGIDSTSYASYAPSSYSPYNCHIGAHHPQQQQQQHQPHVVFVQGNDGVDEDWEDEGSDGDGYGDDESRLVPFSSSSSSSATSTSTPPKRTRPWCARNSTPCILSYMILAIAFVIGYVYLIEAFVERSRASRAAVAVAVPPSSASSPSGGLRGGGVAAVDMAQPSSSSSSRPHVPPAGGAAALAGQLDLDLEPQYYVLEKVIRPVGVGEVPHGVTSGRSLPKEDGTRVIVATGDDSDTSGGVDASPMGGSASLLTPDGGTIVRGGSDEPVRRKMYAGGREKK